MALAVFPDVFKTKARGKVEVELHRRKLPETSYGIDEFHVDLGAVEGRFSGNRLVGDAASVQNLFQRVLCMVPLLIATSEALAVGRIPGGKLDLKFVETEGIQHGDGKVDAAS